MIAFGLLLIVGALIGATAIQRRENRQARRDQILARLGAWHRCGRQECWSLTLTTYCRQHDRQYTERTTK